MTIRLYYACTVLLIRCTSVFTYLRLETCPICATEINNCFYINKTYLHTHTYFFLNMYAVYRWYPTLISLNWSCIQNSTFFIPSYLVSNVYIHNTALIFVYILIILTSLKRLIWKSNSTCEPNLCLFVCEIVVNISAIENYNSELTTKQSIIRMHSDQEGWHWIG